VIRLEILSGKQAGQNILVRRFPFRVGRSAQAGLCLSDPGVWGEHCQVDYLPPEGFVVRSNPQADTWVDSQRVDTERRLANASEIAVGGVRLRFTVADPVPRDLRLRESVTWLFLAAVILGEAWLIYSLPR
jgi:pSer/pThr/pTyr-binding forkhead associated (FHA) protein